MTENQHEPMTQTPGSEQPEQTKEQNPSPELETKGPENDLGERLEALNRREAELTQKERRFLARQRLSEMNLPEALLAHLDLSSGEGHENSLKLALLASKGAQEPGSAPRAAPSLKPPPFATYPERARLFEEDPAAYALMRGQNNIH